MSEDRLVSGLNPLDQWAKPPPIAMSPDLQARPQAPQAPQPGGSPDTIQPSAAKPEVPPQFLSDLDSIIVKKEGGSPTAVSPAGAIGVHQIMPATAAPYLGVPPDKAREMLFDPAVNEKVGKRIIQDLAQRYPGDQQAVLVAYNAGPGAADRWLASGKDPSVLPQETQRYIGEYQQGKGWADEERARHDASFNSNQEMMREFLRLSAAEPAGSAKREELFNKAREASDRATESFEQLRKTPPVYKPVDIMENFGSAAVLIGILGGLFAKRPLTASLNAAGLAMQAQQQQNWDQFKVASEQWKTQAEMGLQQARLAHDQIREVMEDERMAENEKQARLRNVMSGMQLSQQQQAQWQNHYDRTSIAYQAQLDRAQREKERIQEFNIRMDELRRQHDPAIEKKELELQLYKDLEAAGGDPEKRKAVMQKIADLNAAGGKAGGQGLWSEDAMNALVERAYQGDPTVMQQLPRSGPARQQFEESLAKRLKAEPGGIEGGNSTMIMNRLRMEEARSAARVAGRVTMNTELFAQEAVGAGNEVIRTSKLFPRTEIPRVNTALAAYERNTGDPNVIAFGTAISALMNAYGKMSNPTGTGVHDADKERLSKQLDVSLTQGQIEAGVNQIIREGRIISGAAENAQHDVLRTLMPGSQGLPAGTSTGAGPAPAAGGTIRYDAQGNRVQ